MKHRLISSSVHAIHSRKRGRLLILTGARQTGKTTLARKVWPDHYYLSMEDPRTRSDFEYLSVQDWLTRYPKAIIDEAQKLPPLFDTIKACYDQNPHVSYVLLGSSQILLLKKVRESLAGRVALQEIYPLTLSERMSESWDTIPRKSRLIQMLEDPTSQNILQLLQGESSQDSLFGCASTCFEEYLFLGGMPAITDPEFSIEDKLAWLDDYQTTYLQRDLSDIAQLDRLEPFVRCQQALALKTAQEVNYSDLARLSDVSVPTAKRFLYYLELSYQTLLLPAFHRNLEKRLAKMPKIHFLDPGIHRSILKKRGLLTGPELESAVIAEIYKQIKTQKMPIGFFHLRTYDQREVDLLLECESGFIAVECKLTHHVTSKAFHHFHALEAYLDKPLLANIVVSLDPHIRVWNSHPPFISIPAAWLFS